MANETPQSAGDGWEETARSLLLHNHAEALKTARAVERQTRGIADVQDQPWVAHNTTINKSGGGWLQTALLGGAILAGGAIPLVAGLAGRQPAPVSPIAQPPAFQAFDEVTEEKQPNGTWKEVDRQPFGVFPKSKGPMP